MLYGKIEESVKADSHWGLNLGPLAWAAFTLTAGLWPLEINNTFIILGSIPSDCCLFLFHLIRSMFQSRQRCRTKHTSYKVNQSSNKAIHPWFFLPNVCASSNKAVCTWKHGNWWHHPTWQTSHDITDITWHHRHHMTSVWHHEKNPW